jgi:hypothetical protein
MKKAGAPTYQLFVDTGAIQHCPACPQPGVNIPDNWEGHEYRSVRSLQTTCNLLNGTSDLLFAVFLSGDGNFHLQLMGRTKSLQDDPSVFGDAGVFSHFKTYHNYWGEMQEAPADPKVRAGPSRIVAVSSKLRKQRVEHKQAPLGRIDLLLIFQSLVFLQSNVNMGCFDQMEWQTFPREKGSKHLLP